jgi:hypothetical protein
LAKLKYVGIGLGLFFGFFIILGVVAYVTASPSSPAATPSQQVNEVQDDAELRQAVEDALGFELERDGSLSGKYVSATFEPWKENVFQKLSRIEASGAYYFGEEIVESNKYLGEAPYIQTLYPLYYKDEGEIGYLELTETEGSQILNIDVGSVPGDVVTTAQAFGVLEVAAQELIPAWKSSGNSIGQWAQDLAELGISEKLAFFGDDMSVKLNTYDGWGYKLRIEDPIN